MGRNQRLAPCEYVYDNVSMAQCELRSVLYSAVSPALRSDNWLLKSSDTRRTSPKRVAERCLSDPVLHFESQIRNFFEKGRTSVMVRAWCHRRADGIGNFHAPMNAALAMLPARLAKRNGFAISFYDRSLCPCDTLPNPSVGVSIDPVPRAIPTSQPYQSQKCPDGWVGREPGTSLHLQWNANSSAEAV